MTNYNCRRCGYKTKYKNDFRKHIYRKFTCKPILNNINIYDIISKFEMKKQINNNSCEIGEIGIKINNKYICSICNKSYNSINELDTHLKLNCSMLPTFNNIYDLDNLSFENKNDGCIYIIQNNLEYKNHYKIGITTNLKKRISSYRCGSVTEPRLLYYYPCKNIKLIDKQLKNKLNIFNLKRENNKGNLNDIRIELKKLKNENLNLEELKPTIKNVTIYECNGCNKIFSSELKKNEHIKNCQSYINFLNEIINENKKYICIHCGIKFTRKNNLNYHQKNKFKKINNKNIILENDKLNKKNDILKKQNDILKKQNDILKK